MKSYSKEHVYVFLFIRILKFLTEAECMGHGKGGARGAMALPNILLRKALFFYKLFSSFLSIFSFTIIIIKKVSPR